MATRKGIVRAAALTGGLNDSPFIACRDQNQFETQTDYSPTLYGSLKKNLGRENLITGYTGTNVEEIIVPPYKKPIVTIDSTNKVVQGWGTLTEGPYYTYEELATELTSGSKVVTYDSSTRKFTFTNTGPIAIYWQPLWLAANYDYPYNLADPTIFGFYFTIKDASSPYSVTSTFPVEPPPCNERFVFTDNTGTNSQRFFDESKNAIPGMKVVKDSYPTVTYKPLSDGPYVGIWRNNNWYGSDSKYSYVMRGTNRINSAINTTTARPHDVADAGSSETTAIYNQSTTSANFYTLGGFTGTPDARQYMRLTIASTLNADNVIGDYLRADLGWATANDFDINVYIEKPDDGYRELVGTYKAADIPAAASHALTKLEGEYFVPPHSAGEVHFLLEWVPLEIDASGVLNVYCDTTATANSFGCNDDGEMVSLSSVHDFKWCGDAGLTGESSGVSTHWKHKISFINKDGFETNLNAVNTEITTVTASRPVTLSIARAYNDGLRFIDLYEDEDDIEYVRLYRTKDGGSTYFKVCDMKYDLMDLNQDFYDGVPDDQIEDNVEADEVTNRNCMHPNTLSLWWQDRAWTIINKDLPGVVLYSRPASMSFDWVSQWFLVNNDAQPNTAAAAIGERLFVFKSNSITYIYPSGSSFGQSTVNDVDIGCLSRKGCQAVLENGGTVYFQGNDGHFWVTDGVGAKSISKGRLDEFVDSLNSDELDTTISWFDADKREVVWSVCTGSNTTPDTNIVYSIVHDCFWKETTVGNVWVDDYIKDGSEGQQFQLGAIEDDIFYAKSTYNDFGGTFSGSMKTGRLYFDNEESEKNFTRLWVQAKSAQASKDLPVKWYVDTETTEVGTHTFSTTTAAAHYDCGLTGQGRAIILEFPNVEDVEIAEVIVEYEPTPSDVRDES